MELKPGYKQTEVGVIPEEWECLDLGVIGTFSKGQGIRKDEASSGTIPCVRYGEIYTHHNDIIRTFNSRISPVVAKTSKQLKFGDLLFAGSGETKEEIGKCVAFVGEQEAFAGGDIVILSPTKGDSCFLGYLLNIPIIAKQKASRGQGDAVVHISANALSSVKLPLPPLPEQHAIAAALSDVDALIASLDKLIAKKRDMKQAAMQELLTAKRRLPGFSGEWEVKRFPEVCWFQEGPGVRNTQFTSSGVKLLNGTNIFKGDINLESTERYISENEAYGPYSHFMADNGDIVIACSGISIEKFHEKVAFVQDQHLPFCMNTSTMRFKVEPRRLVADYLYQFLMGSEFKAQVGAQATGSAQLNFGPSHVTKVNIPVPPLPEQTAIAAILSDMDTEIAALEQKRDKTRLLKQGMMQELLTGRIRLV